MGAQRKTIKSYRSCNPGVPLRKDSFLLAHWNVFIIRATPLYGSSAKGRRCLKIIFLRNIRPYFSCLLCSTKQKTCSLSRQCAPCAHQAVALPRDSYFHSMSVSPQPRPRAVGSVSQACSICFPVLHSPSGWEEESAGLRTGLVTPWFQDVARDNIWPWAAKSVEALL